MKYRYFLLLSFFIISFQSEANTVHKELPDSYVVVDTNEFNYFNSFHLNSIEDEGHQLIFTPTTDIGSGSNASTISEIRITFNADKNCMYPVEAPTPQPISNAKNLPTVRIMGDVLKNFNWPAGQPQSFGNFSAAICANFGGSPKVNGSVDPKLVNEHCQNEFDQTLSISYMIVSNQTDRYGYQISSSYCKTGTIINYVQSNACTDNGNGVFDCGYQNGDYVENLTVPVGENTGDLPWESNWNKKCTFMMYTPGKNFRLSTYCS